MFRISLLIILALLIHSCSVVPEDALSPDESIQVTVGTLNRSGEIVHQDGTGLYYSIRKDGREVLSPSRISFQFADEVPFDGEMMVNLISKNVIDERWTPLWGKKREIRNYCNEYVFSVEEKAAPRRKIDFVCKVFNHGVAFRYVFLEGEGRDSLLMTHENTTFGIPGDPDVWAVTYPGYYTSQEQEFRKRKLDHVGSGELLGCPLLAESEQGDWLLFTEADLTDWAGMYLRRPSEHMLITDLASLRREPSLKVVRKLPAESPWRVIMIGEDPGDLIESDMIVNLNDPAEYEDVSWIRPGVSAWDRWWSGDYGPDAGFELGMNTPTMEYFIDLADRMDWEYMIVDWTWYGTVFIEDEEGNRVLNDAVDITTPIDAVDIPGLIQYAGDRDVKIILWVHSTHLDRQMDEALEQYERWGAAGIKVDFMDCDDQDMVNWYHQVARKAAGHHLVVDFHGAYKPTGVSRTLPNMLTREGVLGNEYTKWSDRITPEHTVTLPYTRGLLGEMDFTPGGFHHAHRENFVVVGHDAPNPFVMGTRCHQLAMSVVYESAFTVICDSPYNYKDQPGSDFLKEFPPTWDDTRYLAGYPGDDIVLARQDGERWFIGGMTDENARSVTCKLDFLGKGNYRATLWKDAADAGEFPAHLAKETLLLEAGAEMEIDMARGGGFVMILEPSDS